MTSAARLRLLLVRAGFDAEVIEHWRGPVRHDPFGYDVLSVHSSGIAFWQAYYWKDRSKKTRPDKDPRTARIMAAGGTCYHVGLKLEKRRWKIGEIYVATFAAGGETIEWRGKETKTRRAGPSVD